MLGDTSAAMTLDVYAICSSVIWTRLPKVCPKCVHGGPERTLFGPENVSTSE